MTQKLIIHLNGKEIEVDVPKKWNKASLINKYCDKNYPGWSDWEW